MLASSMFFFYEENIIHTEEKNYLAVLLDSLFLFLSI